MTAQTAQERLATSIKEARDETQNTRTELRSTTAQLTALESQSEGDLRPSFDIFVAGIDSTRQMAAATRTRFDTMSADSGNYFESWKADLNSISNASIRKSSQKRLAAVQKQYGEVIVALGKASASFPVLLSDLDDLKTAMSNDLTPKGILADRKAVSRVNESLAKTQAPTNAALAIFDKLQTDLTPEALPAGASK